MRLLPLMKAVAVAVVARSEYARVIVMRLPLIPFSFSLRGLGAGIFIAASSLHAATIAVPRDQASIQEAINSAKAGDSIRVAAGTYREAVKLKPRVSVKSEGNDDKGKLGLKRAERTILEGGVEMAEKAVLDGFTITGVGRYDEKQWQHHFDTQGKEQSHEPIGGTGTPGIAVAVECEVRNNIVHHIGYTGIAITGGSPHIVGNVCYRNMGGGIGAMNGSTAVIEQNTCFENFYAGIGCDGSSPVIQNNTCHGNIRAGIGISEGSSPRVTGNRCFKNRRAGIGIRTGKATRPVVENNELTENDMAGIGVEEGARALILNNRLSGNQLVAIGVTGGSEATITDNELAREGGAPPLIAVLEDSRAVISGNTLRGGGVAAILVKGSAQVRGNHFVGNNPKTKKPSGNALWAHPGATVSFIDNQVEHWPRALFASGAARVVANGNTISAFGPCAIRIQDSLQPAEATGNIAISDDPKASPVEITGPSGQVSGNQLNPPTAKP